MSISISSFISPACNCCCDKRVILIQYYVLQSIHEQNAHVWVIMVINTFQFETNICHGMQFDTGNQGFKQSLTKRSKVTAWFFSHPFLKVRFTATWDNAQFFYNLNLIKKRSSWAKSLRYTYNPEPTGSKVHDGCERLSCNCLYCACFRPPVFHCCNACQKLKAKQIIDHKDHRLVKI